MIRLPTVKLVDELPVEDRSMRVIEYALAFGAILAAGILAFVR